MTSGLCDVGGLYECPSGIYKSIADNSILDRYSEVRREKYITMVHPISTAIFKRLWEKTPNETIETGEFFWMLRKGEDDPTFSEKLTKVSVPRAYLIQ